MPSLTVRNIPVEIMKGVRVAAAEERRSINA
jgi:plasmid stability protein